MNWVPIGSACKYLGHGWGRFTILRRIEQGQLKEGLHWRDEALPDNQRRKIKINIHAIEKMLATPLEQRQ